VSISGFSGQSLFHSIIQVVIGFCVFSVFMAIFLDFVLYSRKEKVQREKKSIVETGTMTLFFLVFYMILVSRAGTVTVKSRIAVDLPAALGTVMIIAGCAANIMGRFSLGRNWANQIKIYQEQTLVQTGMYRFVRHPLYSSIILMFYGACLVYRNILGLFAVTAVFVPFMYYRARQEEMLLLQRFSEYAEYRAGTGMFFPKAGILFDNTLKKGRGN
jgi:protein-S-isoprenylcysteine O-methyltransferase Ste14